MKNLVILLACLFLVPEQAHAQESYVGSKDLGTFTTTATSHTVSYPVGLSSTMLKVLVNDWTDATNSASALSVTVGGKAMTAMSCSGSDAANSAGLPFGFYLINPPTGTVSIVVSSGHAVAMSIGAADYAGVSGFESCVLNHGTGGTATASIMTQAANDWVMIDASGYKGHAAGAGDVLRLQDTSAYQSWAMFDSNGPLAAGSHSFTTTMSIANSINQIVAAFTSGAVVPPTPKSASCNPSSPSLSDNTVSGATVCTFAVVMSDGSAYTGNNTASPSSLFAVPASGNGNLTLARNLASTDDGTQTASLTFAQNGTTLPLSVSVSVTPAPPPTCAVTNEQEGGWVVGTSPDQQPIYISMGAGHVCKIYGKVEKQNTGHLGLYAVPANTPCKDANGNIQGTSLLASGSYFDANGTIGATQVLTLSQSNTLSDQTAICVDDLSGATYTGSQAIIVLGLGS